MPPGRPSGLTGHGRRRLLSLLGIAIALVLQMLAIDGQSLVGDAPYHLLAGHQALRYGQNTLNLEHPPLVKLLGALPLLAEPPLAPPLTVDRAFPAAFAVFEDPALVHRVRWRTGLLLLAFVGLPLGVALWLLGRALWRPVEGLALLLIVGLSFSVFPYLVTLQTDGGAMLGYTASLAGATLLQRRPTLGNALVLGLGAGIALAAKFSALLLLPAVVLAPLLAPATARRRAALAAAAAAVAIIVPAATYAFANRHDDDSAARRAIASYTAGSGTLDVGDALDRWRKPLLQLAEVSPSAAQYALGVLGIRAQSERGVYASYAFGHLSSRGRWWYFPAVLAVKLPLAILLASLAAALAFLRSRRNRPEADTRPTRAPLAALLLCGLTAAIYLGAAMASSYNLGMRHLLPIVPVLYLPAARWAAARPRRLAILATALALEALLLTPRWIAATNTWWLGDANPTRLALSHSNLESHQSFVALAREAERHGWAPLHVVYPGLRPEELAAYLPTARLASAEAGIERPAWYAVNVAVAQLLPALLPEPPPDLHRGPELSRQAARWAPLWTELQTCEHHGFHAGTFVISHCKGN